MVVSMPLADRRGGPTLFFLALGLYIGVGMLLASFAEREETAQAELRPAGDRGATEASNVSRKELISALFSIERQLQSHRVNRAFLSVDVVGSSEMKRTNPELAVEYSFHSLGDWVEGVIGSLGGQVQSTAGDGLMAMFSDDRAAVRAARLIQEGLPDFNARQNRCAQPFTVRCGISSGPVALDPETPIGWLLSCRRAPAPAISSSAVNLRPWPWMNSAPSQRLPCNRGERRPSRCSPAGGRAPEVRLPPAPPQFALAGRRCATVPLRRPGTDAHLRKWDAMGRPVLCHEGHLSGSHVMKFTLPRKGLHEALQAGVRVVSTQTSLPVLKNVMLTASEDSLRVSATDLEIALDQHLAANVQEPGAISVPAKTIADIVSSLAEADVTMAADDGRTLLVTCQAAETKLRGLPGEDFPPMPIVGEELVLRAPEPFLREAIRLCVFAAASDDTRPILTAVRLEQLPGQLTLVATDQHRLAHYRLPLSGEAGGDPSGELQTVLAPARAMEDVGRLLDDDPEHFVELRADGNQISFKTDRFTLVSRVIEGRFPDYQRVLPTSHTIRARIQSDPLLAALRRARILARDSDESRDRVVLDFADNRLILVASGDYGGSVEELDVELEGDNIRVAFNVTYLLEVMDRLHCEAVNLDMTEPLLPAVLSPVDGPDYRMLLMPMHME